MNLDLVSLRALLAVANLESLRAASEQLNLSVSAVSRRLSELEGAFGLKFFERHSRGVEITPAGRLMAERARELFGVIEATQRDLRTMQSGERGSVAVSTNGSAFVSGLAEDLEAFHRRYPDIAVELTERMSPAVVETVRRGGADIGLIAHSLSLPEDLQAIPYRRDRLMLAVPLHHPLAARKSVTLADMLPYPSIGVSETSALTRLMRQVADLGNSAFEYRYMASTNEIARKMVAHDFGIAILPEAFLLPYAGLLPLAVLAIDEPWAERELAIVRRRGDAPSASAALLLDWLQRHRSPEPAA